MPVHARPSSLRPARLSDRSRRSRSAVALHVEHLEQRCLLSASPWPALLAPLAEAEPNDTLDAAQQLGALDDTGRAEVIGAIAPAGADVDWYNFTLNSPASVDLTSLAPADGGQSAAILSLFNSHPWEWSDPTTPLNYRFLAQSTLDGSGNAHITRDLGPGTYNLAVSGAGNRYFQPFLANSGLAGATGDYGLLLTATDLASAGAVPPVVLGADTTAGPAPGATTDRSPAMVYLNLSGPLDPSVQYDLNITLTAAGDSTNLVGNYNFSFDANELAIAPSKALAPGDYDLGIAALSNSGLPALDQDYTFHVHVTGIEGNTGAAAVADDTAATAHDLGDLTQPRFVQVAGAIGDDPAYDLTSLDPLLANPAADVDLYHFRVNDSGNFALIAEVFAGRIGSALDPGLTLFRLDPSDGKLHFVVVIDNSGNDIAATDGSTPLYNDPVLFAGLTAGDYYLAVSSTGNLPDPGQGIGPGDNGVFDPNVAHSGFAGYSTGSYVLNLFIYPDNVAPQVIDATPAEQATLDAPPTSLTVAFDEPVNLEQLAAQIKQQGGPGTLPSVYVHGADGVDYYPRLTDYNMNGNQATFLMLDALPNGVNELHLSGARGVTDLAGNPLASNDPSGDYVVHFTVAGPARGQVATNPGPTHGLWVWNDQEPNNTTTQPQVLGTLFPNELQQGVALVRNATSGASDTVDYYQFEVVESRPYFFTLTGTNLPANAQPYLKEVSTGRSIALIVQGKGPVRLANLDPGVYRLSVGGWTTANAVDVTYTLRITLGGSVENPTPLTAGPTPAFSIRLPPPSPVPPPSSPPSSQPPADPQPPTGTPPSTTGQTTTTQPTTTVVQPSTTDAPPASAATQPATIVTPSVTVSAPTSQTSGTTSVGTQSGATTVNVTGASGAPAPETLGSGALRLVLTVPSTGETASSRVVAASLTRSTGSDSPTVVLRLAKPEGTVQPVEVPSGALIALGDGPLGGVRSTDQSNAQRTIQRLVLQGQDLAIPDSVRLPILAVPASPGGESPSSPERPVGGAGDDQPALSSAPLGYFFLGPWFSGALGGAIWGWILSPVVPSFPADDVDVPKAPVPGDTAAGEDCLSAVDQAWAGALLAAGALAATKADKDRTTWPSPRRRGEKRPQP